MRYLNVNWFTTNYPLVRAYFDTRRGIRRFLRIFFQDEHNLVLPGGRGVGPDDPIGVVPSMFDPHVRYHVRIVQRACYASSDVIVEYNRPNIENIVRSGALPPDVLARVVYAPALPFTYSSGRDRPLPVITNLFHEQVPRRAGVLSALAERCPDFRNIQEIRALPDLARLYSSAKVLVNIHQTDHHHAIEEFRVLPALACGAVVVSEDVPLRETIPYHEHVIWCPRERLVEVAADVLAHHDEHFERIHGPSSSLPALLEAMKADFEHAMDRLLADPELFSLGARARRWLARF